MSDKIKKAEYLLDEIGEIDDALLTEALSYRPARRAPRFMLVAACIVLSIVFVISSAVMLQKVSSGLNGIFDNAQNNAPNNAPGDESPIDDGAPLTLDAVMSDVKGGDFTKLSAESEIPYRDGDAYIVWQYAGESEYYVSSLTPAQLTELQKKLGYGEEVGQTSPELECMVWIVTGNGAVISPYLKTAGGNVGSSVFDYCAEIYPTQDFITYISAIIQ